jgi:hypothetical protein
MKTHILRHKFWYSVVGLIVVGLIVDAPFAWFELIGGYMFWGFVIKAVSARRIKKGSTKKRV